MKAEFEKADNAVKDEAVNELYYKVQEHRLESAWKKFEEAGFNPILIKGWAAGQFYPKPHERHCADIDLMFDEAEFSAVEAFNEKTALQMPVDLHKGARHLDELPFKNLLENSILKMCGQTEIRVPRDEDHLRILCVHWLNDGGADKERLKDIYYAVQNRSKDFDWERCLGSVSRKRRKWVITAILLAHKYLDLDIRDLPISEKEKNLPKWLLKTVEQEWKSGIRLTPLNSVLGDKKKFWEQFKKRLFLNPIQATVLTNGAFDNKPRIFYQAYDIIQRTYPSLKRIFRFYSPKSR